MPDRTLVFGESTTDARYQAGDSDPAGGDFELLRDLDNATLALLYNFSAQQIESQVPFDTDTLQFRVPNESPTTIDPATGTVDIDFGASGWHDPVAVTENITLNFTNIPSGGATQLLNLTDGDGAGPYTITYPSSVVWPGGTAVTEVSQNGNTEVSLRSADGGTTVRATAVRDFS
jgi:hypothetical protein